MQIDLERDWEGESVERADFAEESKNEASLFLILNSPGNFVLIAFKEDTSLLT